MNKKGKSGSGLVPLYMCLSMKGTHSILHGHKVFALVISYQTAVSINDPELAVRALLYRNYPRSFYPGAMKLKQSQLDKGLQAVLLSCLRTREWEAVSGWT